jgi:hypothetical protein
MPPITFEIRQEIANRLMGGQTAKGIGADLNIALKTVYRLKAQFLEEDGTYVAVPGKLAIKQAFTRDQLVLVPVG